ncbi:MAG: Asp-tRNA(Asn)/Glu-tRNA(Gln) amidotransferase subunit GatB [Candidatus Comchoanobacterales bacterium]
MSDYQIVIGIEVHVQLNTSSKLFSPASTAFGAKSNSQADIRDLGLPGVLPILNKGAVEKALMFACAIDANINQHCDFSRKNYFYPDLPKGYQITQHANPIISSGRIEISTETGEKVIRIHQAHLEEDAGKSIHDVDGSNIDLNRAGNPLLEVVSEPDLFSIEDAVTYCKTLHHLVRFIDICDGNMQQGNFRCDVNVSLRKNNTDPFGTRVEIKNINSFKFIEKALKYEVKRQSKLLDAGQAIVQETRLYDENKDITRSMRSKENANDYRYFPEPDVPPLLISDSWIKTARSALPELPAVKLKRYQDVYALPSKEVTALLSEKTIAEYFDALVKADITPKDACNWLLSVILGVIYDQKKTLVEGFGELMPSVVAALIKEVNQKSISHTSGKKVLEYIFIHRENDIDKVIDTLGLRLVSDDASLKAWINEVFEENPKQLEQYRSGNERLFGFFVGQVMKKSQGGADPQKVNQMLKDML